MLTVFYHPLYTAGIDPAARFPRSRYQLLAERLAPLSQIEIRTPRQARTSELSEVHDHEYVARFLSSALSENEIRRIGLKPWKPEIITRTLHLMGGSIEALEQVLEQGGFAGNLAGGTHHAHKAFGSGYCIFNDLAICAERALKKPGIDRVLILDLDVHQGDGTAAMMAHRPEVMTVSIHCEKNFPFRKQASDLDIGLPEDTSDAQYLETLDQVLEQVRLEQFDLLIYQAGVDPLVDDRLGKLAITRAGLDRRNRRVFDEADRLGLPTLILMGGGYSDPIEPTIDAFYDLFTAAAEYTR